MNALAVLMLMAITTIAAHAAEREMTCRGRLIEVANTGGDNFQIGPCTFTIDQYSGVAITDKCRLGQPCVVRARVEKDSRALWIKHVYGATTGIPGEPGAISDLLSISIELNSMCRGGTGEHTDALCALRDQMFTALTKMGYCYGKRGQIGADMEWHKCTPQSLR